YSLLALSEHAPRAAECPLWGVRRTSCGHVPSGIWLGDILPARRSTEPEQTSEADLQWEIKNWELVLETRAETPLSPSGPTIWTDSGAFRKHVVRPGVLQDQTGPSIATELGVLLPDSIGSTGVGASVAGIISQRWDWAPHI